MLQQDQVGLTDTSTTQPNTTKTRKALGESPPSILIRHNIVGQ